MPAPGDHLLPSPDFMDALLTHLPPKVEEPMLSGFDDLQQEVSRVSLLTRILEGRYRLIIFDVDGTIVCTQSGAEFRERPDDWMFLPGRTEIFAKLHRAGIHVALATNQGGAAFGYFEADDMAREIDRVADMLKARYYISFTHPSGSVERLRRDSFDRKPKPGMILQAMIDAESAPTETLMIGDRDEDKAAAEAAGCSFVWADRLFPP